MACVYGSEPQFLLASATIANPGEQARALTGLETTVVDRDAAPRAERTIVFWNPPLLDEELGVRASALGEAARILAELVSSGQRTICFAKGRKAAELIHRFTCDRVPDLAGRLSPYRAGYTPAQRREIERRLVEGDLLGVTATDALGNASTASGQIAVGPAVPPPPPRCVVPRVEGKRLVVAKAAIRRARCAVGGVRLKYSRYVRRGRVIAQTPAPGKVLPPRAKVSLVVSRGRRR
jgi:hypothetical protein